MAETYKIKYLTLDEYLDFETNSPVRHELVAGNLYPMEGPTDAHEIISGNLFGLLFQHLKGNRCVPYKGGMKVLIKVADCVYYPDIMVTCEPIEAKSVFKLSPCLVAEVMSPSTKNIDRREKYSAYQKIESMQEILLISQDRYLIELYTKESEKEWQRTILRTSDSFSLASLPRPLKVSVAEIYDRLNLPSVVEEEEAEYEVFAGGIRINDSKS